MYGDVLYGVISLIVILAALTLIYIISGLLAPRGRHGEHARKPFTGGIELPGFVARYFTDMVVFTAVFLLSEALALAVFLAPSDPILEEALLVGAILVYLPPLIMVRRR